jgi:hypothetical protein
LSLLILKAQAKARPGPAVVTVRGTDPALTWAAEAPV